MAHRDGDDCLRWFLCFQFDGFHDLCAHIHRDAYQAIIFKQLAISVGRCRATHEVSLLHRLIVDISMPIAASFLLRVFVWLLRACALRFWWY